MSRQHLEVKLDPLGTGTVFIDGIAVSKYTNGIEIKSYVGGGTKVLLSLAAGMTLDFAQAVASIRIEGDCPHCRQRTVFNAK